MAKQELESERLYKEFEAAIAIDNKMEGDARKNIMKYFDRIHDKLFTFNNIIIAGFFALSKIEDYVSLWMILVPISNLMILIYIEYRMMEMERFTAASGGKTLAEIKNNGQKQNKINLFSLLTILTTFMTTSFFLYVLIFLKK